MKRSYANSHKHSSNAVRNEFPSIEINEFSNNEDFDDEKDENKRKSRNLSEKKRRDQFNLLIGELCSIINYDTNSSVNISDNLPENQNNCINYKQKMDKSSILRSSIAFLKSHSELINKNKLKQESNEQKKIIERDVEQQTIFSWKPSFLVNDEFIYLMLEALDSFIIIIDANSKGKVIYISETVIPLLGMISSQINSKIINSSDDSNSNNLTIYDLIHSEETNFMEKLLEEKRSDPSFGSFTSVLLHFKDHDTNSESDKYQLVRLLGSFYDINNFSQSEQNCFVAIGRLQTPKFMRELSFQSSTNDNEFVSRHSLEWKFLYLDHRAPPIIGYLPFEILGTSGYDYYHWNDLDDIVSGHEQLMRTGEGTSCVHRFLTKSQQWIWLRTSYYIAYHQWNFKPEFIVCTHTVVKDSKVSKAKIDKMNLKIENKIDENRCSALSKDNFSNSGFSSDSSSVEPQSSSTSMSWWSSNQGSDSISSSIDYPNMSRASTPKRASQMMSTTTTLSNSSSNSVSQKANTHDSNCQKSNSSKSHSQLHEFLQQQHELLQHQIKQQQEELRRVTEQLVLVEAVNNQ